MVTLKLTDKEAVVLAGILGATEGMILSDVYKELFKQIKEKNDKDVDIVFDIVNLIDEVLNVHENPVINEDFLYNEAVKLNNL